MDTKRLSVALSALWLACSIGALAADPEASGTPRLEVQTVVDVGQVTRGKTVEGVFELRNVGTAVLDIPNAKPSCGCTLVSYDGTIEPGQTGRLTAKLDTHKFRGPVEKTIQLTTNDPQQPTVKLSLKADVVVSAEVLPAAMLMLPHPKTWDRTGRLVVRKDPTEAGELRISNIKSPVAWLSGRAHRVDTAEPAEAKVPEAQPGDWILELEIAENAPVDRSRHVVTFETGLTREPTMEVTVGVDYSSALLAKPHPLPIRVASGETEGRGVIEVLLRPDRAGEELKASVEPGAFSVELERATDRSYRATVVYEQTAPEVEPARLQTKVLFTLGEDTLLVPVFVRPRVKTAAAEGPATSQVKPAEGR